MNQQLIHRSLNLGLVAEAKQLQRIDRHLTWLLHKSTSFDFVAEISQGRTLLVGEGNLSFTLSLAAMSGITPSRLIATTFENKEELSSDTIVNAEALRRKGVTVLHSVDGSSLASVFGSWRFDTIVFQFPHAGSRDAVEGHNPNFILVRDFLISAATQLHRGGKVLISAVDSPHYRGAFQFDEAADIAGFAPPESYPFDPSAFPEYEHTMTHQSGSAIGHHDEFSTWVFRKQV
ncbi:MAG: DUF2431 domain-containing protein [Rickettsiales bacterium]|nr:DUF2431 domain-containing protein [Rickettsiales bacterium]